MHILVINLDRATERWATISAKIGASTGVAANLQRIAAIDAACDPLPIGSCKPSELACWASHLKAIELASRLPGPVLICEDDVEIPPGSLAALNEVAANAPAGWSMIYPEVGIASILDMVALWENYAKLRRDRRHMLLDAVRVPSIFGTVCYLVSDSGKRQLLSLLKSTPSIDKPIDLVLREAIQQGRLMARVCLPFLTSISALGDTSSIQAAADPGTAATDQLMNAFRRMLCYSRDVSLIIANVEAAERAIGDEEAALIGRILALKLSPRLKPK